MKKYNLNFFIVLLIFLASINQSLASGTYDYSNYTQNKIVQRDKSDIIEFVMDYSGSMRRWINLAELAFKSILPQIPATTKVGLRIFGPYDTLIEGANSVRNANSGGSYNIDGCLATRVLIPPQENNPSKLISSMSSVSVGGVTPLTYALQETVSKDFAGKSYSLRKKIILITDGKENCGGNPCEFVKELVYKRRDIKIDVIKINGYGRRSSSLKCLAESTGGNYYDVKSDTEFEQTLEKVLGVTQKSSTNQYAIQIYGYKYKPTKNYTLYKK